MSDLPDEPRAVSSTRAGDLPESHHAPDTSRATSATGAARTTSPNSATTQTEDVRAAMPIAKRTRVSTAWVGAVLAALLLVLLLVFILQNGSKVPVNFLWLTGHLPLGVALLFAAVGGVLLMGLIAGARVVQLRVAAHRVEKAAR